MNISPHLKKERILLDLKSKTKEETIKEILEVMKNQKEITNFEGFLNDVIEREKIHTTGIGDGIALPHARSKNVKDFFLIFARSKQGIDFNAIDEKPVHLIFLMGAPQEGLELYLKVLAHLNRLLAKNQDLREKLLSATNEEEIVSLIEEKEK